MFSWFSSDAFMPHGHCYLWEPALLWTQLLSNALIALAYISIASTLAYLVYRVGDLPFRAMYLAFGVFIVTCGMTHLLDVWVIWHPDYWLDGAVRTVTAIASVGTAIFLPPLVPKALALARGAKAAHERGIQLETMVDDLARMYQATKEAEEQKTRFFANISHELRTPLTLILGPAEALRRDPSLAPEQRRETEVILRNARTLLKHVDDLLAVARLEANEMQAEYQAVDVTALVQSSGAHFDSLARDRNIAFTLEAPPVLAASIDRDKVQRVVLNLLANAFKFTPPGGRVRLRAAAQGDRIRIEVADSGPGIPEEQRERIFERFSQVDQGPTRRFGGTGLGLAIARDFVQLHGGTITATAAPEGGALFVVELPSAPASPAGGAAPNGEAALDVERMTNVEVGQQAVAELMAHGRGDAGAVPRPDAPRVLVVEDAPDMNRFILDALAADYAVASAFDGRQGLEQALANPPDLVITDVMMPVMAGDELLAELRARPETRNVPVMILSAGTSDDGRVALLRQGASDYLTKPFAVEELRVRASNLMAMKRAREILQRELDRHLENVEDLARELAQRNAELRTALESVRIARDAAERASHAKSTFLAVVSHELRTPLQAINLLLAKLKRDETLGEGHRATTLRLESSVKRLHHLIESILEFTRIESGRLALSPREVDLAAVAQSVIDEHRSRAEDKGLELALEHPPEVPPLLSDEGLLRVVLSNLVGNAVKFTERGRVTTALARAGARWRIEVRDTGPGIPLEHRPYIFEPFTQLEEARKKHLPGVGLGLSLVREIVAGLGGTIEVESEVGQGTVFRVILPEHPPSAAT